MGELSEVEQAMLRFESQYWRLTGAKERAIRETFDVTSTEYYLHLARLIDRPEAMAAHPMTVKKLLNERDSRARSRARRQRVDVNR